MAAAGRRDRGRAARRAGTLRGAPGVTDVRVLGAIGVVQTDRLVDMAAATAAAVGAGVWLRPFRDLVYTMPPYISTPDDVAAICRASLRWWHRTDACWLDEAAEQREQLDCTAIRRCAGPPPPGCSTCLPTTTGPVRRPPRHRRAARAPADFGAGSTGSRLVSGTTQCHTAFEADLVDFTGFGAGLLLRRDIRQPGAISALVGRGDSSSATPGPTPR